MPLTLVRVDRVGSVETSNPHVRQYFIDAHTVDELPLIEHFVTLNSLRASLCQRGKDLGRYVWIAWKDGRYATREIVTVKLDDSAFQYDAQPAEKAV